MDLTVVLPAIVCTLLAIIVTALLFRNRRDSAACKADNSHPGRVDCSGHYLKLTEKPLHTEQGLSPAEKPENKEECGFMHMTTDTHGSALTSTEVDSASGSTDHEEVTLHCKPVPSGDTATVDPYRPVSMAMTSDLGITAGNDLEEWDADNPSLKYVPGMLRINQLEKMMTKEEMEVEKRAQQEQLAAIFQLLKENQETFGEVSEGDVEEQLKLYSI